MRMFTIIFFFFLSSCYELKRDCATFKTGFFEGEIIINNTLYKSTFKRYDNLQIEFFDGKIDTLSIRWINDCEMIFKSINPKNKYEKKNIHIKILSTTDESYEYEYGYPGESIKRKGIAKRID